MGGGKSAECEWGELLTMPIDYLVTDTELSDIADAIRAKGGTSASISFPNGFTTAIAAIPTGITPTGTKQISITQNGTITEDVTNYASAEIAVNVSGGLTNIVQGSFTAGEGNVVQTISVPYTGSGYPIGIFIYVKNGMRTDPTFSTMIRRNGIGAFSCFKTYTTLAPTYTGSSNNDDAAATDIYKSSDSSPNTLTGTVWGSTSTVFRNSNPSGTWNNFIHMASATTLKIYPVPANSSTSYGLVSGIEYEYVIVYSS